MYKIVYSLRVMKGLIEKGFFPVKTLPNPKNVNFNCWVFESSEELDKVLDELIKG